MRVPTQGCSHGAAAHHRTGHAVLLASTCAALLCCWCHARECSWQLPGCFLRGLYTYAHTFTHTHNDQLWLSHRVAYVGQSAWPGLPCICCVVKVLGGPCMLPRFLHTRWTLSSRCIAVGSCPATCVPIVNSSGEAQCPAPCPECCKCTECYHQCALCHVWGIIMQWYLRCRADRHSKQHLWLPVRYGEPCHTAHSLQGAVIG